MSRIWFLEMSEIGWNEWIRFFGMSENNFTTICSKKIVRIRLLFCKISASPFWSEAICFVHMYDIDFRHFDINNLKISLKLKSISHYFYYKSCFTSTHHWNTHIWQEISFTCFKNYLFYSLRPSVLHYLNNQIHIFFKSISEKWVNSLDKLIFVKYNCND